MSDPVPTTLPTADAAVQDATAAPLDEAVPPQVNPAAPIVPTPAPLVPKYLQRKLVFHYKDVQNPASLALGFARPSSNGAGAKLWRTIELGRGEGIGHATYVDRFAVGVVNAPGGTSVAMTTWKAIMPRANIELLADAEGGPAHFGEPSLDDSLQPASVRVTNRCGEAKVVSFGVVGVRGDTYTPIESMQLGPDDVMFCHMSTPKLYGWVGKHIPPSEMVTGAAKQDLAEGSVFREGLELEKLPHPETVFLIAQEGESYSVKIAASDE